MDIELLGFSEESCLLSWRVPELRAIMGGTIIQDYLGGQWESRISMVNPKFRLEVSFSETTGELVAAYLRVREATIAVTREVSEGIAFADYGADGDLLGIELLAPCSFEVLDQLSENEPEPIRRFLLEGVNPN